MGAVGGVRFASNPKALDESETLQHIAASGATGGSPSAPPMTAPKVTMAGTKLHELIGEEYGRMTTLLNTHTIIKYSIYMNIYDTLLIIMSSAIYI